MAVKLTEQTNGPHIYMLFGSGKNSHYGPGKISQM